MDRDCSHCGCQHTDIKFKSQLRRKRHLVNKLLEKEIGQSSIKWFDDLTEQSIQRQCSATTQVNTAATLDSCAENSPVPTRHSAQLLQGLTPGGGSLTPLSTWALLATQDTCTPKLYRPVLGISPAFVSTPKSDSKVKSCTNISKELGLDNSAISWTSSMATPCLKNDTMDLDNDREDDTEDNAETAIRIKGFPRVLFTPDRAGLDSEDFGHVLEVTGDNDTLAECVSMDASLSYKMSPSSKPTAATTNTKSDPTSVTDITASPVLKKVNKRLSLGTKCSFETPNKESKIISEDQRQILNGKEESVIKVKCESHVEDKILDTQNSPFLERVNERLSLGAKCSFQQMPKNEAKVISEDQSEIVCGKGETIIEIKNELQMDEDEMSEPQNCSMLSPSSTNSVIVSALSPFFDSPTSGQEKQRAAPKGVKRKAVEMISLDDELKMSSSSGSSQSLSQTGPHSILSSATKRTASERKRVRFAADVEKSDKSSRLLRKQKSFSSKDDDNSVENSEKIQDVVSSGCLLSDNSSTCDITMQIVNLNINNSCDDSLEINKKSSADVSNDWTSEVVFDSKSVGNNTHRFRENIVEHSVNLVECVKCEDEIIECTEHEKKNDDVSDVLHSQISVKPVDDCMQTDKELKTPTTVKCATGDELFSQVSPSSWNEMCQAANKETNQSSSEIQDTCLPKSKSANSEPGKPSNTILEPEPKNSDLCKSYSETDKSQDSKLMVLADESKEVKNTRMVFKRRKFLYPSGSQISRVSPQCVFKFHNPKRETDIKPDDVNLSTEVIDGKPGKEKTRQQGKESDSFLCEAVTETKPVISPTDIGYNEIIKPKTLPRRRNSMGFTKFSELFAEEMSETDWDTRNHNKNKRELSQPLKTLDSQITSKGLSSISSCHSRPDPFSKVKDNSLQNQIIVECKTIEKTKPSIGVLAAEELFSCEELEEKNDYDFDMNTQEVENFVKDAFLDDMEFSQIITKDSDNSGIHDNASTEIVKDKTDTGHIFCENSQNKLILSKDGKSPDKHCSKNVDIVLNETTQQFKISSQAIHSKDANLKNTASHFDIIDNEISIKCFCRSNSETVSKYLSSVNEEDSIIDNCDVCTVDPTDLSTEAYPSCSASDDKCIKSNEDMLQEQKNLKIPCSSGISYPSFSTASGKGLKVNKSALQKAIILLECEDDKMRSLKIPDQSETCASFSTAIGKGVKINKSPLKKDLSFLEHEQDETKSLKFSSQNEISFPSTASGRMKVNKSNLQKAQTLLEKEQDEQQFSEQSETCPSFSTASGKGMKINKNALQKAQTLLECEKDELYLLKLECESETFYPSFSTASGKDFSCNQSALQKAEALFAIDDAEPLKKSNSFTSFSKANGTQLKVNGDSCNKTLPPFHLNSDAAINRRSKKDELQTSKQISDGQRIVSEADKISKGFVGKNFFNEKEKFNMLESDNAKNGQFDAADKNANDNFEEMLDSILANKKKCDKVTSMSKMNTTEIKHSFQTSFETLNFKNNSFKTIDPLLKPKGFRPFKKPKLIDTKKPSELDSSTNNNESSHDKMVENGCQSPQQLQLNVKKAENIEKLKTDEAEMNEIMLKEFCHDIFSQCPSPRFSPQDKAIEDMPSFNSGKILLEKSVVACSPTACTLMEESSNFLNHSQSIQLVDNVRKYKLTENDDTQVKVEANISVTKKHKEHMEAGGFGGQGFQTASGKKVHISKTSLLKANKILADKTAPDIEVLSHSESCDLEKNDCINRLSKGSGSQILNKTKEMQSSSLPLENSKSLPVPNLMYPDIHSKEQFSKQQSSIGEESPLQHLHPLLTDDTLFQDDMINDSEKKTEAKECLLKSWNRESKEHYKTNISTCFSFQAIELDIGDTAVQNVLKNCDGVSNKTYCLPSTNIKEESSEECGQCEKSRELVECSLEDTSVSFYANDVKRRSCMFQTASGQSVDVSQNALEHAKSLWENDSTVTISNNSPAKDVPHFETDSRKCVDVSEEELHDVRADWEDEEMDVSVLTENNDIDVQGFLMASNKPDTINEKALQYPELLKKKEPGLSVDNKSITCNPFQTASGKTVGVSKTALHHAKSLWGEQFDEPADKEIPNAGTGILQTASGKEVAVSKASLSHAKSLWEVDCASSLSNKEPGIGSSMFQTAHGKPVDVSKDALHHARSLCNDASSEPSDTGIPNKTAGLFQTASGKEVTVSRASLSHATSLWEGDSASRLDNKEPTKGSCMFQTALGKTVSVSKTALDRAKSLWNENDDDSMNDCTNSGDKSKVIQTVAKKSVESSHKEVAQTKTVSTDENCCLSLTNNKHSAVFQTAAGKCVDVSDESLSHVSEMFNGESTFNVTPVAERKIYNNPFQTASGNTVTISDSALKHTKKMFEDFENNFSVVSLFQTASGNNVNISREALQHVQNSSSLNESERCLKNHLEKPSNESVEISHVDDNGIEVGNKEGISCHIPSSSGNLFQMASRKSVSVSETALNYARSSMNELNKNNMNSSSPNVMNMSDCNNAKKSSCFRPGIAENKHVSSKSLFQLASGNTVNVSEKVLKHAAKLMNGDTADHRTDSSGHFSDHHDLSTYDSSACKTTNVDWDSFQNLSNCNSSLTHSSRDRKIMYNDPVSSTSRYNKNSSNQEKHNKNLYTGQSNRILMDSRTSVEKSFSSRIAHSSITETVETNTSLNHDCQRVTGKKVLHSTPEGFYKDRWSGKGKKFVPLYSSSLSERSGEYTLENIVGKQEPMSALSSFKTPYKKSPFVPIAEKPENPQAKKTKAPIFTPKVAIKYAQPNNRESILPTEPSEMEICSTKTSSEPTEQESITEVSHFEEARKKQEEIIGSKKKEKVRPSCGRMFAMKSGCSGYKYSDLCLQTEISVQQLVKLSVLQTTINISSQTAKDYRFQLKHFYPNLKCDILVGDCAFLVADDDGFAGTEEFYKAFLTIKGVDPALVTDVWVINHYKWIVWKLAAYEVSFPRQFGGRCLTPDWVMLQLKYRYDREIDHCQRSCLKKIMEKDDTACKRMVLCVSGIITMTTESNEKKQEIHGQELFLELTDGWYSIKGKMDAALLELVERKQIVVGQKLCISGAELGGSEDACPPLEAPASLFLKLSMNSTRPASWDSKLGYQRDPRPLCVAIGSLHSSGGLAGCIDAVVLRVYPVMYMEKMVDSTPIFRTAEAEERIQRNFDQRKHDKMEKLYEKIQADFEQEESREHRRSRRKLGKKDLENLQSGQEICEAVESSLQPEELHSWLSVEQQHQMEEYQRSRREQRQQQLQAQFQKTWDETHGAETNRNVTPVMKIRIVGCARRDVDSKTTTIVTIWRPSADWMEIKEGKRYLFFGLVASSAKTRLTSHSVHLTASRQSCCKECPIDENYLDLVYEPREVWKVRDLRRRTPPNKEFDFVGITVEVSSNSDKKLDTVYAADVDGDIIGIRYWGGIQTFGISDLLQVGKMFVGRNLVLKWSRGLGVVSVDACMEVSHFSHAGNSQEQRKCLDKLKSVVQAEKELFINRAKVKLCSLQGLQPVFTPERKHSVTLLGGMKTPRTPGVQENIDMDFLDNLPPECVQRLFSPMDDSGNSQKDSTSKCAQDDKIKKQKSAIRSKVAKLLAYGSPKTISPLNSTVSPAAFKRFKPPSSLVKNLSSILE